MYKKMKHPESAYRRVAVLGTTYSLFYYLLLTGEEGLRHTYFVLTDGIPSPLRDKLPHQFVHNHYGVSKPIEALYRLADYLRLRLAHRLHHLQGLPIYGHDHLPASYYYTHCRREPFYVVEDGTHNYIPDRIHLTRALVPLYRLVPLGPVAQPYGRNARVSKVYLTGLAPIPEELQQKAEVRDLLTLWQEAPAAYRQQLIHLFQIPELPADAGPYHLLITQPLSEDHYCTEAEKLDGYRQAVCALPPESLLIKPHPREHTDYRLHFPQATVLGGLFPVEVLLILYADRVADVYSVDSSCMAFIRKHLTQPVWEIRCLPHPSEILSRSLK